MTHPSHVNSNLIASCFSLVSFLMFFAVGTLPMLYSQDTPIVIAHRGASGYLPEHTLAAKALAYGMGADYIEQDLVLTKDDVPVVLHDIHLDTISNVAVVYPDRAREDGRFYAIDFTFEEIKTLECVERFNPRSGNAVYARRFPKGWSTFRVPSFIEEIELIQGLNKSTGKKVGIYPELKQPAWHRRQGKDISKIVLQILEQYGYTDKSDMVYVQCFEAEELKRIRNVFKSNLKLVQLTGGEGYPTGHSDSELNQLSKKIDEVSQYADGIGPSMKILISGKIANGSVKYSKFVEEAHRAKLVVHPYTLRADALPEGVTSFDQLQQIMLIDSKVDGFFTDFPDQTKNVLLKTKR